MFDLFIFDFFDEEILLDVDEGICEVICEIVPEELLKKECFYSGEDVGAALLTIKGLELLIVARFITFLFHTRLN